MIPKSLKGLGLEYFSRGKRSRIYRFKKDKKTFAVKVEREGIGAKERIKNEVKFLKILNKYNIGPKLVSSGKDYFVYEFIEGKPIMQFIEESKDPFPVLRTLLKKCRVLDKLGINKLEMHHPMKHVFIKGKSVKMIDFERCYFTDKPKNVTQFCQFLIRAKRLNLKKESLIPLLKQYKKEPSEKNFGRLLSFFS